MTGLRRVRRTKPRTTMLMALAWCCGIMCRGGVEENASKGRQVPLSVARERHTQSLAGALLSQNVQNSPFLARTEMGKLFKDADKRKLVMMREEDKVRTRGCFENKNEKNDDRGAAAADE
jgi:hypothetical protein